MPAGRVRVRPHDGRADWHNPDPAAVVSATRALGEALKIDYEHQGEYSRQNGQPAPAAGWIKRVFERDGAVLSEVEWTEKASAYIRAKEYRWVSPVFSYDPRARNVRRIQAASLTNDPELFIRALARAQSQQEDPDMDLAKIRQALGLAADAGEEKILAPATALADAMGDLAEALGAEAGTDPAAMATAAVATAKAGGDPDPKSFVPRAEFDRVSERLNTLETGTAEAKATAAVDAATREGKIAPAPREWALGYAKSDPDGFAGYVKSAPVIVKPGEVAGFSKASLKAADGPLSEDDLAACKATGVDSEEFKKTKAAMATAGVLEA